MSEVMPPQPSQGDGEERLELPDVWFAIKRRARPDQLEFLAKGDQAKMQQHVDDYVQTRKNEGCQVEAGSHPGQYVVYEGNNVYGLFILPLKKLDRTPLRMSSSAIKQLAWSAQLKILKVYFASKVYLYHEITPEVFVELVSAESVGSKFNQLIYGRFPSTEIK